MNIGLFILLRDFEYRLLHKALATLIGYLVLANSEKLHSDTTPLDEKNTVLNPRDEDHETHTRGSGFRE